MSMLRLGGAEMIGNEKEFRLRLEAAEAAVAAARESDHERQLADALRALGNIQRRAPEMRDDANLSYTEAIDIYHKLGLPLDEAWVTRHIGINHEHAGRLTDAESSYEKALGLYRAHSKTDDLDYANSVRYLAVIKDRRGKRDEAYQLWQEAVDRYGKGGIVEGIAEGTAHLTLLALDNGDIDRAAAWFEQAEAASQASKNPATQKLIGEVRDRMNSRLGRR
jgi:tetratricopeptide (TPR) repeat protein